MIEREFRELGIIYYYGIDPDLIPGTKLFHDYCQEGSLSTMSKANPKYHTQSKKQTIEPSVFPTSDATCSAFVSPWSLKYTQ